MRQAAGMVIGLPGDGAGRIGCSCATSSLWFARACRCTRLGRGMSTFLVQLSRLQECMISKAAPTAAERRMPGSAPASLHDRYAAA
jgi:hypothetical protein